MQLLCQEYPCQCNEEIPQWYEKHDEAHRKREDQQQLHTNIKRMLIQQKELHGDDDYYDKEDGGNEDFDSEEVGDQVGLRAHHQSSLCCS